MWLLNSKIDIDNCINREFLYNLDAHLPQQAKCKRSIYEPIVNYLGNVNLSELNLKYLQGLTGVLGSKFAFVVLYELIIENKYNGECAEILYSFKENVLKDMLCERTRPFEYFLYEQTIRRMIPIKMGDSPIRYTFIFSNSNNNFYRNLLKEFILNNQTASRILNQSFISDFEAGIGSKLNDITCINDFTEEILWKQFNYIKAVKPSNKRDYELSSLAYFYRWVIMTRDEYTALDNADSLSKKLIASSSFIEYIKDDYLFVQFDPKNPPYGADKIIFLMKGYEHLSTRTPTGAFAIMNLTKLKSRFYKDLIINYYLHLSGAVSNVVPSTIGGIIEGFSILEEAKNNKNYPNPRLNYITNQEAYLIQTSFVTNKKRALRTLNNIIGWMRRILLWSQNEGIIECEDMVFSYLKQYEEPSKTHGNPIPKADLNELTKAFHKESLNGGLLEEEMAVIYHLCLETEFRINTICHLTIDCIKPSFKPDRYKIVASTKTSHGVKESYEITTATYDKLQRIMNETAPIRELCNDENKKYLFIYKLRNVTITVPTNGTFGYYMSSICKKYNLPHYNSKDLRDTHMTQSLAFAIEKGKSDIELASLTKHRYIDTTLDHYAGQELEKMLECTYNIIIGEMDYIDASDNVLDNIPDEINDIEHEVEDGCGKCRRKNCIKVETNTMNSLPCFCCKDFVTSAEYIPFFKQKIQELDAKLLCAVVPHDIEDITTIKRICVKYLEAIYEHLATKETI